MITRKCLFGLLLLLPFISAWTQLYPVTATLNVSPPYSVYLADYVRPGANRLLLSLMFNDYNEPSWDVYLKIKIESINVRMETKPGYRPLVPVTVYPGQPLLLKDDAFAAYLDYRNMVVSGISMQELSMGGKLPEGYYSFSVEVYDYQSGKKLSNVAMCGITMRLLDPPVLVSPVRDAVIPMDVQQIWFQWQMNQYIPGKSRFILSLYEVVGTPSKLANALKEGKARQVFESGELTQTSYLYGPADPLLEKGKTYISQVRVMTESNQCPFKNNGVSEPTWFCFGYPENGNIPLLFPEDNYTFRISEEKLLEWNPPDNLLSGQFVKYYIKAVEAGELTPEKAMEQKPWFEYKTDSNTYSSSRFVYIKPSLRTNTAYNWQVEAFTGNQKIAQSKIYRFFSPPYLEEFWAGNHKVTVTKTTTTSLDDLCGEGLITIGKDGKKHKVIFHHLKLLASGSIIQLEKGRIAVKAELENIPLKAVNTVNKEGIFVPDSIILDKNNLKLLGVIAWDFPHPVNSGEKGVVYSKPTTFRYNTFELLGRAFVKEGTSFNLLEPINFSMIIHDTSYFEIIDNNTFSLFFGGEIVLPENVQGRYSSPVKIPFARADQLFYIDQYPRALQNPVKPVKNTNVFISPGHYIFDLSGNNSPGRHKDNTSWKGLYFEHYYLYFYELLDPSGQVKLLSGIPVEVRDSAGGTNWCYVNSKGLQHNANIAFTGSVKGVFNTFPCLLRNINYSISNSFLNSGQLEGDMKIPVISVTKDFGYTLPMNNFGFSEGYLNQNFEGFQFVFNPDGGEQKMNFTINRAVFTDKQCLDMNVDIGWPQTGITMSSVGGFRIWGDYKIGFGTPQGSAYLDERKIGKVGDFAIIIDKIGCGKSKNLYALGTQAEMVMGEDVAGVDGPPLVNLYSIMKCELIDEKYTSNYRAVQNFTYPLTLGDGSEFPGFSQGMQSVDSLKKQLQKVFEENTENQQVIKEYLASSVSEKEHQEEEEIFSSSVQVGWKNPFESTQEEVTVEDVLELLRRIDEMLKRNESDELAKIKEAIKDLSSGELATFYHKVLDSYASLSNMLENVSAMVAEKILKNLTGQSEKIKKGMVKTIHDTKDTVSLGLINKVNLMIDGIVSNCYKLASKANIKINTANADKVSMAVKNSTDKEIQHAIDQSVEKNITGFITGVFDTAFHLRLLGFIDSLVYNTGDELIDNPDINAHFGGVIENTDALVQAIGKDIIARLNTSILQARIKNLGDDIISNFNWDNIAKDISNQLLGASVQDYAEEYVKQKMIQGTTTFLQNKIGGEAGNIAGQLMQNMSLDFDNLGDKLKNGQIDQIIKFDPSYIVVKTKVADFEGWTEMYHGDSLWGDSWQAELMATIKIEPPLTVHAKYINGAKPDFQYWFLELGVQGIKVPMAPIPFTLNGISGKVYHHMSKTPGMQDYMPDVKTDFGAGLGVSFYDSPTSGTMLVFDMGLEMAFMTDGFMLELNGNAAMANTKNEQDIIIGSLATGSGYLNYNSAKGQFLGCITVVVKSAPFICSNGTLVVDVSKSKWYVAIGTEEAPVVLDLFCANMIKFESWFSIYNGGLDLGLRYTIDIYVETPWIKAGACNFMPWAKFYFQLGAKTSIVWIPEFGIKEAEIWAALQMGIGVKYDCAVEKGNFTAVAAYLEGRLKFQTLPKTRLRGELKGGVTVLCVDVNFKMNVDKTLN